MGMVPELAIAVLACARIGAVHSVIFGGFSAQSIADRIQDAQACAVITQDGALRGNKIIPLKSVVDDALMACPTVQRVIVATHARVPVSMLKGRDCWWEDEIKIVETQGNPFCNGQAQGGGAYLRGVHGLGQLHVCQRFSVPARLDPLLHGRHRVDHRAHLHFIRSAECGRHLVDV
jgi:hypothetical protein